MSEISKNKQLIINMTASFIAVLINMGINLILSPYIVENVGAEAYGFVQIGNNLIAYFSIITIALNSMASRFISISFFCKNLKEAREYYTSSFLANVIFCVVISPALMILILNLEKVMNISINLVADVKLLIAYMTLNFLITLLGTNLGVSFYVKNKLYISSFINILGYLLKAVSLLILFTFFNQKVAFVGLATLCATVFIQGCYIYYKRKLIPELYINKIYFCLEKIKTLISSGIWNSITRIGSLLQEGLDLIIADLLISAEDMGILAVAKTIPIAINSLLGTLIASFMPNLTELYANNKKEELKNDIKQSMKIIGMMINIPIALLIGFGDVFYRLWVPSQNAELLQRLSIVTIAPWIVMGQATIIHKIFTVVNKIKINSLLVCFTGFLNVAIVYILLKNFHMGLFAVAGVSSVLSIARNLIYTVPFGAIYIKCPWYTFYPEIVKSIMAVTVTGSISFFLKNIMNGYSWGGLIGFGSMAGMVGFIFNYFVILNKKDRNYIRNKIRRKG